MIGSIQETSEIQNFYKTQVIYTIEDRKILTFFGGNP